MKDIVTSAVITTTANGNNTLSHFPTVTSTYSAVSVTIFIKF
jgi:hypothetical protein